MSAKILDGKACSEQALELINKNLRDNDPPTLVIYRIGDDPASAVYIRNKVRAAERVGIDAVVKEYPANTPQYEVWNRITIDAANPFIDGMMVQLPLPEGWDATELIERIPPEKDVDGLTYMNAGKAFIDDTAWHQPCTAKGIIWLLHENGIHLTGKHVVVVGRSEIVGKPVAMMALANNATVTICHSRTKNLAEMTRQADILIVAVGKPGLITADMVKPGAVVVDVGINRDENGKLCGDVDFDNVKEVAGWITPVPGGVGPMTVAMLMHNTMYAQGMNR
jgi:methylenetetrahydrofolate dehydrogenase (NADP+)/methenyltetrahydrofolate cyclohydrolase